MNFQHGFLKIYLFRSRQVKHSEQSLNLYATFNSMTHLKIALLSFSLFFLSACETRSELVKVPPETNKVNQFQAIWNQLKSDPVEKLPQVKVSYRKLVVHGEDVISSDASRTLSSRANILPYFEKLAHPNGICFKGQWNISKPNKYSGYFKKDSKGLIIVRASSAMSNTKSGEIRSFGFAGKLFPTISPLKINQESTANFFLIDDLGGTRAKHYTDVELTNSPTASITSEVIKSLFYILKLARTFSQADQNPKIRQVYEISQLGETNNSSVITPKWMKVKAVSGQTVDESDFRNELSIRDNNNLVFRISVASDVVNGKKDWLDIGKITLDSSVISKSCDHRLHFHHPKWRSDLIH